MVVHPLTFKEPNKNKLVEHSPQGQKVVGLIHGHVILPDSSNLVPVSPLSGS